MQADRPQFDKRQVRRAFDRAAAGYDQAATVQREMADEIMERLDFIKFTPRRVLDVGCGTGYLVRRLARRYRRAVVLGLDLSATMLVQARDQTRWFQWRRRWINADAERLPLADASLDMLVSTATLQWCDLRLALTEFSRVLRPGGLLMFASFGPDTLREIRTAWAAADPGVHVHEFLDMHEVGDALLAQGFENPVMDVDRVGVTHANVADALRAIQEIGSTNLAAQRARGLTGRNRFKRFKEAYAAQRRDGRLSTTYEVVYGHAWAPVARHRRQAGGEVAIPVSAISRR
ncbi:MAG: malonyl-ACP O-methyltransferase BioC [Gammaproteobacteria bacterium]|nr:malonyl-ACP O-methyltransferase BioC [Gammaproteobacteria bacterium]